MTEQELKFETWTKDVIREFKRIGEDDDMIDIFVTSRLPYWKSMFFDKGIGPKQAYNDWDRQYQSTSCKL
jgi:hypothetical protein